MKLSKAQERILRRMAGGDAYCRHTHGPDAWGYWLNDRPGQRARTDIRSIWKLEDLGLIGRYNETWSNVYYQILDAGRTWVEEEG